MDKEKLENFERAFRVGGLCVASCHCGKSYYNCDDPGIDWEDGEFERYEKDENYIGVDFHVGEIILENKRYVDACDCWHERAEVFIKMVECYWWQIADYLTLERERWLSEAKALKEIPTPPINP